MSNTLTDNTDTINLREVFLTMKKYKNLIIGITILFTLLAVIYTSMAKPIYQVRAMIELGEINDKPLADLNTVKQKLEYIYGVKSKKKRSYPIIQSITIPKFSKNIFSVSINGYSNADAISFTDKVVNKVKEEYAMKIDTYMKTQKDLITLTTNDIKIVQNNLLKAQKTLADYNQKIINITAKDAALAGIYTIQISQNQSREQSLQSRISVLKEKVYNLKLSIMPLRIKQTHIVGKIEVLNRPVKPKKVLVVIVSLITGLMFSIFLVFFLEFLKGQRKE